MDHLFKNYPKSWPVWKFIDRWGCKIKWQLNDKFNDHQLGSYANVWFFLLMWSPFHFRSANVLIKLRPATSGGALFGWRTPSSCVNVPSIRCIFLGGPLSKSLDPGHELETDEHRAQRTKPDDGRYFTIAISPDAISLLDQHRPMNFSLPSPAFCRRISGGCWRNSISILLILMTKMYHFDSRDISHFATIFTFHSSICDLSIYRLSTHQWQCRRRRPSEDVGGWIDNTRSSSPSWTRHCGGRKRIMEMRVKQDLLVAFAHQQNYALAIFYSLPVWWGRRRWVMEASI